MAEHTLKGPGSRPARRAARAAALAVLLAAATAAAGEPALQGAARTLLAPGQGVYVRAADGTVLAAVNADRPMHPASVTKIATSLALLRRLGPAHRFTTRVVAAGRLDGARLRGDLVVEAGGDPFFVTENALLVLAELEARGLRAVDGALRVRGPFLFNWRPDPEGRRLARVLGGQEGTAVWDAVVSAWPDRASPERRPRGVRFSHDGMGTPAGDPGLVLTHRSPALVLLLKSLNCYSNNVFHLLSDRIGGPPAVEAAVRDGVPADVRGEIVVDDAAGLGTTNRMSARAAVAVVDALAAEVARQELTLAHVLPVAGRDPGTLRERLQGGAVVAKTGTIGSLGVSALAGRVLTHRYGAVTFAVIHRGIPVAKAQREQDAFVRAILATGEGAPWPDVGALASIAATEIDVAR